MVTINDDTGRICCATTDPTHMCSDCKARMKGRRGRTDNALVANSAREPVNEFGLTANQMIDLCDGAIEMTRRAGEASDKAAQSSDPSDHAVAAAEHDNAESWNDSAADERTGTAASVHSQFARDHHEVATQHRATGDFLTNDYEDDVDDSSDATQNENRTFNRRKTMTRRPSLAGNSAHNDHVAYLRSHRASGRAIDQAIRDRAATQGMTTNCQCDDSLIPPTMGEILGIAAPTTNSSMPNPGELIYEGLCDDPDAMVMPRLDYDRLTANVTGSAAGHSVPGGKGYLTATARDRQNIPGFNITDAMDRHFPDGNTGSYPRVGVRDVPPLTSGRPRVRPTLGPPESGGNVGSYPSQGTRGDMGETDSAGDDYEDGRGSRSNRGRALMTEVPQYGNAPPVEDRTAGQQGTIHQGGQSMYSADFFRRMTPGGIGLGANPQAQDYDGESYERSPTQAVDSARRQFGSQKMPTANGDDSDALIAPTMSAADWQQQSRTWSKNR